MIFQSLLYLISLKMDKARLQPVVVSEKASLVCQQMAICKKCWASKAAPWHLWLNHTGTPSPDAAVMVANVKSQHSHHVNQNVMLKHRSFSSKTNKFMGIAKFF